MMHDFGFTMLQMSDKIIDKVNEKISANRLILVATAQLDYARKPSKRSTFLLLKSPIILEGEDKRVVLNCFLLLFA